MSHERVSLVVSPANIASEITRWTCYRRYLSNARPLVRGIFQARAPGACLVRRFLSIGNESKGSRRLVPRRMRKKRKRGAPPTCTQDLAAAEHLLCIGRVEEGREILEHIVKEDLSNQTTAEDEQTKKIALYTLAILNLNSNEVAKADLILQKLGLRFRLSSPVFHSSSSNNTTTDFVPVEDFNKDSSFVVRICNDAVPRPVVKQFAEMFNGESPFWKEHRYGDPSTGYFSYSFQNIATAKPQNVVEALIQTHLYPLVERSVSKELFDSIAHAEWWCHSRDKISGHQLHYDTDETRLTKQHELCFPVVSSVWYITPGYSGAPTLITNKRFGENAMESTGALVFPEENRFVMFDGSLLHGVVPRISSARTEPGATAERITLMVGFWDKRVSVSRFDSKFPKGNMEFPTERLASASKLTWSSMLSTQKLLTGHFQDSPATPPRVLSHPCDMQLWEDIGGKTVIDEKQAQPYSLKFVGKYFLENLENLDSEIALLLPEPTENEIESILHASSQDSELLVQKTLCVLYAWMKQEESEDNVECAGDHLLELTAKSTRCRQVISKRKAWLDLFLELLRKRSCAEIISGICWNLFKDDSCSGVITQSISLIEALVYASKAFADCSSMACGALACWSRNAPFSYGEHKSIFEEMVPSALSKGLYELYVEKEHEQHSDEEFSNDISDYEDALYACLHSSLTNTEKVRSFVKGELHSFYSRWVSTSNRTKQ